MNAKVPFNDNPQPEFESRPLSIIEYYHACVGRSARTLDKARENTLIIEGKGRFDIERFKLAVERAARVNPGVRLRMSGDGLFAKWHADGQVPAVRVENRPDWSGASSEDSEFFYETTLDEYQGLTGEIILVEAANDKTFLIYRNLHSVMDGLGTMHFIGELFRDLRGEQLLGSNAHYKDTDLMARVESEQNKIDIGNKPVFATGGPEGEEIGDCWQRIVIDGPIIFLLARLAATISEFAHQFSDGVSRIAIPVNMRRHSPDIVSTMNYSNVIHVDLEKGEKSEVFQKRLHKALRKNCETMYSKVLEVIRCVPLAWLDFMMNRKKNNYLKHRIVETVMISDLGAFKSDDYSCDEFTAQASFGIPLASNTFALLSTMDGKVSITVGMPKVYASNGRLNQLMQFIANRLGAK